MKARNRIESLRRYELLLVILLAIALMLPFIGQAIHIDAHQWVEWAQQGMEHPLWQHFSDYDYFGVHYETYFDTHPRLHSLYLALFIWLNGGEVSEPQLHLAVMVFPLIALVSMYFLARRFKVHALLATLLLLVSPAFLVNSHLLMIDIPGLSLWLASLALFIYGVDRRSRLLLSLSALVFMLTISTYYQGISVLPLAFLYLVIQRRFDAWTVTPIALPLALLLAYIAAFYAGYGRPPLFSYNEVGLPMDIKSIFVRTRGTMVMIGGALIFPLAALVIYLKGKAMKYAALAVAGFAMIWSAYEFFTDDFPVEAILLLPLLLVAGLAILWEHIVRLRSSLLPALRNQEQQDKLFLSTWFLGVVFYCAILLPYPSPRFMLPMVPPFVIVITRAITDRWGGDGRTYLKVSGAIAVSTLVLAIAVAVGEHHRAENNRVVAEWAAERFSDVNDELTIWFSGGLGFQHYIKPLGYKMVIQRGDSFEELTQPAKGDLIIESVGNNRWPFRKRLKDRLELADVVDFGRRWPVTTEFFAYKTSWIGQIGMVIPYGVTAGYLDRIYIYEVRDDPPVENVDYCADDIDNT